MILRISILLLSLLFVACSGPSYEEPVISLQDYKIEEGFDLEMVASEPLLKAPVAMDFDSKGRIWVTEMTGYMDNMEGKGEDEPTGSIKILEDRDDDGVMDHAKPFLDSLVLPRALALVYGGLLYAEPPFLYFVDIENDSPKNRVVVDSLYAAEGNPEHQPNGLVMNIDNWIYSAKSNFRYRKKDGEWLKEPTTFRGQWGISHDNFGRLYYNDNSRQLLGDYVLPNRLTRNRYFTPEHGVDRLLTEDQRVYPAHATLVNRGYAEGVLDKDSVLVNVTASCGPQVYRGSTFPEGYDQNVFVCVPEANLIKRNILTFHGDSISAEQAWQDREFLTSTDRGFRPVSLSNGMDGSLYIVDMHRGVIGHHAYLSPYFRKKARAVRLDTIVDYGRILKISRSEGTPNEFPDFDALSADALVRLLDHENGAIRDRAQHYLIYKEKRSVLPELTDLVKNANNPLAQLHALYTLEGLNALSFDVLTDIASTASPENIAHALVLMERFASEQHVAKAKSLFTELMAKEDRGVDLYLGSTLGIWAGVSEEQFLPMLYDLSERHIGRNIYNEALVSGLDGKVKMALAYGKSRTEVKSRALDSLLMDVLAMGQNEEPNPIFSRKSLAEDNRTRGAKTFRQICAACHGINGKGIEGLAPPLMNSEYVSNSTERLGLIILHGLSGPLEVNGKQYDLNQAMPGLLGNDALSDEDIADVISYVTNAFSDTPKGIAQEKVKELRNKKPESGGEYTVEELERFSGE